MHDAQTRLWRRSPADPSLRFGAHRQRVDGLWHVGGQPPLGRLDASMLRGLATLSEALSPAGHAGPEAAALRITPWQGVLFTDVPEHAVSSVLAQLAALGIACDGAEPLTRLIACAGSPGCAKSAGGHQGRCAAPRHAAPAMPLTFLTLLRPPTPARHTLTTSTLTGCPRSCAAAHCAQHTLLAVGPGRYDLYRRDRDDVAPGFGHCIAHHLTIEQAGAFLQRPVRSLPHD